MTSANAFIFVAPFLSPWSSVFCHLCPLGWTSSSIPFPDPIFNAGQQQQALVLALPRANDEGNNNPLLSQQPRHHPLSRPTNSSTFLPRNFPFPKSMSIPSPPFSFSSPFRSSGTVEVICESEEQEKEEHKWQMGARMAGSEANGRENGSRNGLKIGACKIREEENRAKAAGNLRN